MKWSWFYANCGFLGGIIGCLLQSYTEYVRLGYVSHQELNVILPVIGFVIMGLMGRFFEKENKQSNT